ncbi:MAG TPA: SDR family oxidoreductase [Anaerolineales bacterium]|nr:SDR family oxidoreductase [Anaerolineales bacterium]
MQKTVFITGADRGLGLSLVRRFLRGGFHVFAGTYSSGENLKRIAEESLAKLTQIGLDVTDLTSVQCAAQAVAEQTSSLDILINNAAVHLEKPVKPLEELDFGSLFLQGTMNVNAFGPLYVTQQFLPLLNQAERKLIVNISSEAGSITDCKRSAEYAYCMSKSALNMASKILQNYLKPRGFKVLAIQPGWMRTDMGGMDADFHPDEVAEDIFQLLMKPWHPDDQIFMDRLGNSLPW